MFLLVPPLVGRPVERVLVIGNAGGTVARAYGELYPDVRCKVLYQRDYLNLLIKYGLEQPSQKNLLTPGERSAGEGGGIEDLLAG